MKARINTFINNILYTPKPLPNGTYQAILKLDTGPSYRLHLRIEEGGLGILILNASTIMHLNATAAEFAYHLIKATPEATVIEEVMKRYRVTREVAEQDFLDFKERLETLVSTPDLDPETFLNIDRVDPFDQKVSAPMRLDCALTYQVSEGLSDNYAPTDRVKSMLSTEEWKQILKTAWDCGIPHIIFTGGEPTLRPDLPELITFAEELGQVAGLITDGTHLTEKDYLHKILNAGLDHLMLVLNTQNEQTWEAVRDCIVEDIFLTVHLTLNDKNKDTFDQTLQKLKEMQVRSLSLSAATDDLWKILPRFSQKAAELGFSLVWDLPVPYSAQNPIALELDLAESRTTGAGINWLYVEPDGDVLAGQGLPAVFGNMLTDSWERIWSQAKMAKYG